MSAILAIALLVGSASSAPETRVVEERTVQQCINHASGLDDRTMACYFSATANADRRMNRAYASLRKLLDPGTFASLQIAQRRWIAFRDANRLAQRALMGESPGTLDRLMDAMSDYDVHRSRADELEGWLARQR